MLIATNCKTIIYLIVLQHISAATVKQLTFIYN